VHELSGQEAVMADIAIDNSSHALAAQTGCPAGQLVAVCMPR